MNILIIINYFLRFLVIVTFILGIVSPMLTPLSQIAFWGMTWERIFILIFLIAGMIIYIQTEYENRKRPNIKIRPVVYDQVAKLEIINKGGYSRFEATAVILNEKDASGASHIMCCDQGGHRVDIGKGGVGTIIIADQTFYGFLRMPVIANGNKAMINISGWPRDQWGNPLLDRFPNDVLLGISITSDKVMKKSFSGLIFKLSQKSIKDLQFEYMKSKTRKLKIGKDGYLQ